MYGIGGNTDKHASGSAAQAEAQEGAPQVLQHSVCLLYWYKSANTDAREPPPLAYQQTLSLGQPKSIDMAALGSQFTCFTGTKVQILTPIWPH